MFHKEFALFGMRQNIIYKVSSLSFYTFLVNILAGEIGLEVEGSEKRVRGEERAQFHWLLLNICHVQTLWKVLTGS